MLGAPGVGKTFFGCQLAVHELRSGGVVRRSGQRVLFLTFARNAVAQIRKAYIDQSSSLEQAPPSGETVMTARDAMKRVRIDTFGAFCWWLVMAYARYLPDRGDEQPWLLGKQAVGGEHIPTGHVGYTFEQLHEVALAILEIPAVRSLVSDMYPVVIVDEHQDVDPVLHNILTLLCRESRGVLLRGPGQSVYGSMKAFDPEAIFKQTLEDLKPELSTIHPMGAGKTRHCPELAALLARYDSKDQALYSTPQATLRPVPKVNKNGIPNRLETFVGLTVQTMKRQLSRKLQRRSSICVLTSTNSAAALIHARLLDGSPTYALYPMNAALLFNEDVFLQYGRLVFVLLEDHWIAKSRTRVNIELAAVNLMSLAASFSSVSRHSRAAYLKLAEHTVATVRRFKKPKAGQSSSEKLRKDLARFGELLRETKESLPAGMPSTPFTKHDTALLSRFAAQMLTVVEPRIAFDGRLDISGARLAFEKAIRQKVLLEKSGVSSPIQVMTIHKAKGREFDGAVLVLEDDRRALWRASSNIPETERVDLYRVGLSRARELLVVVAFDDSGGEIADSLARLAKS